MGIFDRKPDPQSNKQSEADARAEAAKKAAETREKNKRSAAAKKAAKTRAENKKAEEGSESNAVSDTLDADQPGPSSNDDPRLLSAPEPATLGANDRRADDQAIVGHFVTVTKGKNEGRYGVLREVAEWDGKEPKTCVVVSRDDASERLVVPYKDLTPSPSGLR